MTDFLLLRFTLVPLVHVFWSFWPVYLFLPIEIQQTSAEVSEAPWAKWAPNRSDRRRLSTLSVYNESGLKAALSSDSTVTYITLTDDIYLTQVGYALVFRITHSVTIDGDGYTLEKERSTRRNLRSSRSCFNA